MNMKDSGIKWIGEIPEHWDIMPIRFLFTENKVKNTSKKEKLALKFTYGTIIPKENFDADNDEYVFETISNYTIVKPGTIMVNCLNLNYDFVSQRIGLVRDNGAITSAYLSIVPGDKVDSEFATYQLKYWDSVKAFHNMGTGVRKTLNFDELGKKYLPYPPIEEQRLITVQLNQVCGTLDNMKTDIEKQIEILQEYKKSVITDTVTKGLDKNVELKDSRIELIGEIPKHWSILPLKRLVDYNSQALSEKTPDDYEFDYVDISSVTYGKGITEFQHLKFKDAPSRARRIVKAGDVILSTVRTYLKAVATIPKGINPIIVSTGFVTLTAKDNILPVYLRYLVQNNAFISDVERNSYGVNYPAITSSGVVNLRVALPPIEQQEEIIKYLDDKCTQIDSIIETKKQQLELLEEYKKSIIYEYVTGKRTASAKPDFAVAQNTQSLSIESAGDSHNE